jgi:hypothetical protein
MRKRILFLAAVVMLGISAASAKSAFDGGPPEPPPCQPGVNCIQ